jgi:hypothetical protein
MFMEAFMCPIKKVVKAGGLLLFAAGFLLVTACKSPVDGPNSGDPKPPNKTSLIEKIDEAQDLLDSLVESDDGTDINENNYWVSSGDKRALELALEDARDIAGKPNATAKEIRLALEALTKAYNAADAAKQKGTKDGTGDPDPEPVVKTALEAKIAEAQELLDSLMQSNDGTDVDKNKYWVISALKGSLAAAIAAADGVVNDADATEQDVQAALNTLTTAYNAANTAKQWGTKSGTGDPDPDPDPVDKTALEAKIAQAETLSASLQTSANGNDIPPNEEWVTVSVKLNLANAIQTAQDVVADENATAEEVDAALSALNIAYEEANSAKRQGTTPDKAALEAKIAEAWQKMGDVNQSDTGGSEHRVDELWVSSAVYRALQDALTAAENARYNNNATKNAVDTALANLQTALGNFNPQPGISVADKDELNALIEQVTTKLGSVAESVDGRDVYDHLEWATAAEKAALEAVLDQAHGIATNATAAQEAVDDMTADLQDAFDAFKPQAGKKAVDQLGFVITFNQPGDETITLSAGQTLSWIRNDELPITVTETFASYQWYIDGAIKNGATGNSISLFAGDFARNSTHFVTLKVTKGGVPYTKTLNFRVE